MNDNDVNPTTQDDQAMLVDSVFDAAPIVPGKVGHHTVLSVGEARVIALSFDRGQHMKEHRSHHPLILQALDGHVQVTAAGQTLDLRPGALMYLPNALAHSVEALAPSRVTLTPLGIAPPADA
jgi:quercetin dioxygenase-like cupin family protein